MQQLITIINYCRRRSSSFAEIKRIAHAMRSRPSAQVPLPVRSQRASLLWKNARLHRARLLSRGISGDNIGTSARTPPWTRRYLAVYDTREEFTLPESLPVLLPVRVYRFRTKYSRECTCMRTAAAGASRATSYGQRWRCTIILLDKRRAAR